MITVEVELVGKDGWGSKVNRERVRPDLKPRKLRRLKYLNLKSTKEDREETRSAGNTAQGPKLEVNSHNTSRAPPHGDQQLLKQISKLKVEVLFLYCTCRQKKDMTPRFGYVPDRCHRT